MVSAGGLDFEAWYRREHPRLVASLLLVGGDLDVAEDAADEAFARALARWDRVGAMVSPKGWTYRVALNVLRRRYRRRTLESRLLSRAEPSPAVPPPAGEAWLLVRDLPPRQRTAVVLRHVADLTEEQVGSVMGIARSSVSSLLADAHTALRSRLTADQEPHTAGEVNYA